MSAFREIEHFECTPDGDRRRFLWVGEPDRGRIYGAAYEVTRSEVALRGGSVYEEKKKEALNVLLGRLGKDEYVVPEGSTWDAFRYLDGVDETFTLPLTDITLILDDLDLSYETEGYDVEESAPRLVIDAYRRLRNLTRIKLRSTT